TRKLGRNIQMNIILNLFKIIMIIGNK
mgnify:CR=1